MGCTRIVQVDVVVKVEFETFSVGRNGIKLSPSIE